MNRFLLLTGIGPTVSRDDALTWIQVVFAIITTHLIDYHKDHHYHWQYDLHQQIYQMFSNAIWFPTLFGRWQSYFVTRSMIGIPVYTIGPRFAGNLNLMCQGSLHATDVL